MQAHKRGRFEQEAAGAEAGAEEGEGKGEKEKGKAAQKNSFILAGVPEGSGEAFDFDDNKRGGQGPKLNGM